MQSQPVGPRQKEGPAQLEGPVGGQSRQLCQGCQRRDGGPYKHWVDGDGGREVGLTDFG